MSTQRVIKLKLLTQTDLVKVETSARTLGELKQESLVKALGIDWNNAKLIDRASKASFDLDESILPAIDALMFITPTKTKSGADLLYKEVKAKIKEYKENGGVVDFNYTQATTAQLNEFWNKVSTTKPSTSAKHSVQEVKKVVESVKATKVEVKETNIIDDLDLLQEVETLLKQGAKLQAVKLVKDFTNLDLKASKDFIDNFKFNKIEVKEVVKEDTILVNDIAEVVTKSELNSEANYLKSKFYK